MEPEREYLVHAIDSDHFTNRFDAQARAQELAICNPEFAFGVYQLIGTARTTKTVEYQEEES